MAWYLLVGGAEKGWNNCNMRLGEILYNTAVPLMKFVKKGKLFDVRFEITPNAGHGDSFESLSSSSEQFRRFDLAFNQIFNESSFQRDKALLQIVK